MSLVDVFLPRSTPGLLALESNPQGLFCEQRETNGRVQFTKDHLTIKAREEGEELFTGVFTLGNKHIHTYIHT